MYKKRGQQNQTRSQRKGRSTNKTLAGIFKIQPEDNIEFDEGKKQMVNQHRRQHLEEFQEEETREFNRLD